MNLLLICSENRLRSPTAAAVFSEYDDVDAILVMEKSHRNKVSKKFRALPKDKKLAVLDIPDNYDFMDADLVRILKAKVPRYVRI